MLNVSPDLALPLDVAGEAIAVLAKRGAGKTNTSVVLVEEMLDAGVQVVVLDPVGVWWGLRASGSGDTDGYPIAVLGGEHGDVPLEQTAGSLIADVVVDTGQSLVLDLSDFPTKAAQTRFVTEFIDRLYRRKARSRSTLHVVLEEADEFAPQRVGAAEARMVGAVEQMVKRGRSRGLGLTMIAQRSASLNKNVLDQADTLIVMRTTGPRDRKAVEGWIEKQDADGADAVLPSLPSLETGEAWIWNPERSMLARVKVRARRTFDSSATPKAGEKRAEPGRVAAIDLEALGERIQATAERAKENDPKELRAKITKLERALAERPTEQAPPEKVLVEVEVPALTHEDRQAVADLTNGIADLSRKAASIYARFGAIVEAVDGSKVTVTEREAAAIRSAQVPSPRASRQSAPPPRVAADVHGSRSATANGDGVQLKAGARRILETLASVHPLRVSRAQLGVLAKFKITGGTFQTYWSLLKREMLVIEGTDGLIEITPAGFDSIGHEPREPMTPDELVDMWRSTLKAGARRMLDELLAAHPAYIDRDDLADRLEMTATGGTFQTYLSTLRRNGLAEVDGSNVRAGSALFLGATA